MKKIINKAGESFLLKRLAINDSEALGRYFDRLSEETKQKFGPHPLTQNYATFLCHRILENALRFVLVDDNKEIQGYFIIDFDIIEHEAERYLSFGIELNAGKDIFFAASIADKYQNSGLASNVMPFIIELLKEEEVNSVVLLGGTRETNVLAVSFYEKFGFKKTGGYHSDVYNCDMQLTLQKSHSIV